MHKSSFIRSLTVVLFMCLSHMNVFSESNKVLAISSYGTDYQWSNKIMDVIESKLEEMYPSVEFMREFLSSESMQDADEWDNKINVLLHHYKKKPPLAIILISDEAWMAYRDADISAFKGVPLILCAVKPHSISTHDFIQKRDSLRLSDFTTTTEVMKNYNSIGVLRRMNIPGYLSLMNNLIPNLNRFVFITDKRFYGVYTHLLLQEEVKTSYPTLPVEYLDARFVETDSLLARLPQIPSTAGVLMTSWLTGEYGFKYSRDFIYSQMENKLTTPIFITNNIGLEKEYFLGGYFNTSSFWGDKIADIALDIISGEDFKKIKVETFYDDQCRIAWKVFKHYQLDPKKLPAKVEFYNAPESFWITYKNYLIGIGLTFLIFFLFYLYTLRSNFKLQHTQRLLIKSVEEARTANVSLEQTKAELIVALHKAEESDRLKSAFLANMSHEIRTPLNAIVGFSGVLGDIDSAEERNEYVELIKRNSDLLLQLLSDILDISRIEAGILEFTFCEIDALAVCTDVLTSLESKCKPEVTIFLNKSLVSIPLQTDPNRLMQVLLNLVNNAIKFTSKGSIEIGYFPYNNDLLEFYVKDTGIGLSKDKSSAIFERFTKLNPYIEGTGLGLSICKTIIEILGGEIGVESEEGAGSRFWFRIKKSQTAL